MTNIDQREEARYRQDVLRSYRAWLAYLEAQQTLLAASAEAQAGIDPFEGMNSAQERAEAARRRLGALPADRRELFDAIYDQDRQQIQRQLDAEAQVRGGTVKRADPDEVARRALSHLMEEARGLHRDDRRGLVPRGKPDAVKWLALDLTEIEQVPPSETDYQISGGRSANRRGMIVNVIFAVLALAAIPVVLLLLRQPGPQAATQGTPTGNGTALTPWPVVTVGDGADHWTLSVQPVATRWPAACTQAEHEHACWQQGSFRPLQLCLPASYLADLTTLRIAAPDGLPVRSFTLGESTADDVDLIVSPCAGDASRVPARAGQLRAVEPAPTLAPGDPAPAGFQVTAITTRGRGEDPDLPERRLVLSVIVQDSDDHRDWVALAPTVLLADGSAALPGETHREGAQLRFDYLIADQPERFDVCWQVTRADQVVRYRATLEPPPTRDTVLRTRLRVEDLAVTPSQQTMTVQLTLHNLAATPLVVGAADLGFQTQTSRHDVAAPTLRQPLAPDERRSVAIDLPLESGVLQIGPFRSQLTVRR